MAVVASNEPAGLQLRRITFHHIPEAYERPGQFITVAPPGGKPGYFALASSPGDPAELLVKAQGDTAAWLASREPGDAVEISEALGAGYAMEQVAGRELVVLCNGSGISSLRPVLEAEISRPLSRRVHFLYGVMTPAHRSYLWDLERWANAGVRVHTVVDSPDGTGWHGTVGFVQEAAAALGLVRDDVGVVLCGVPPMIAAAKAMYAAAGVPPERLLTNF